MAAENDDGGGRECDERAVGSGGGGSGPDPGSGSGGGSGSGRVFLSYNSEDRAEVEPIDRALRRRGIDTFMDTAGIEHGKPVVEQLEAALARAAAVLVCLGEHGLGSVHKKEKDLALQQAFGDETKLVWPVLLPSAPIGRRRT